MHLVIVHETEFRYGVYTHHIDGVEQEGYYTTAYCYINGELAQTIQTRVFLMLLMMT